MKRELIDSNIEWLGKIPTSWIVQPLKRVINERNELNKSEEETFLLSLTIQDGIIPYSEKTGGGNKAKEDISKYKIVKKNDIVINSMNVVVGASGISKYDGLVSPVYYVFSETNKSCGRFYNYLFLNQIFENHLFGLGNGILVKINEDNGKMNTIRKKIPIDKLKNEFVPVPPLEEQIKISNYLDDKVSLIDYTIENNKREIELLEEYKKSLISDVVLKGIGSTTFKDVNSDWIDCIPSDWELNNIKAKYYFSKGLSITKDDLCEDGCKVINYGQIHSKDNNGIEIVDKLVRYVPDTYIKQTNSLTKIGDHIFADTSEDLGGCGNSVYVDLKEPIFAGYHTIILHDKEDKHSRYFAYLFQTDEWRSQIRKSVYGVKLYSITQKILKSTSILIPPYNVQEQIVNYLDKQCTKLDKVSEYRKQIIEKLEEYKKSLIYEAVTGKIEV